MKFKPILIILFIIICAGNFSPIQAENNESIINHNVTSTENIGFFYEVYAPDSQNLAGYIFGVVHPLTKKYAKKVLSLNPLMEKAFNSSTIYLPEVNILAYLKEIDSTVNETFQSIYLNATDEEKKIYDENAVLYSKHQISSFDAALLNKAGERILQGKQIKILNLESLQDNINYLLGVMLNTPVKKINENFYLDLNLAWIEGNEQHIMEINEIYDQNFFNSRNAQMALSIDYVVNNLLKKGEKFFAFPGAGHLYGEQNVLELLIQRGYRIERIKPAIHPEYSDEKNLTFIDHAYSAVFDLAYLIYETTTGWAKPLTAD